MLSPFASDLCSYSLLDRYVNIKIRRTIWAGVCSAQIVLGSLNQIVRELLPHTTLCVSSSLIWRDTATFTCQIFAAFNVIKTHTARIIHCKTKSGVMYTSQKHRIMKWTGKNSTKNRTETVSVYEIFLFQICYHCRNLITGQLFAAKLALLFTYSRYRDQMWKFAKKMLKN